MVTTYWPAGMHRVVSHPSIAVSPFASLVWQVETPVTASPFQIAVTPPAGKDEHPNPIGMGAPEQDPHVVCVGKIPNGVPSAIAIEYHQYPSPGLPSEDMYK
jgi:hypothetical protein